jgi:hypothetical protein
LSANVHLTAEEMKDFLEAKDIAKLYELWSYFTLVKNLSKILRRPTEFGPPARGSLEVRRAAQQRHASIALCSAECRNGEAGGEAEP